MKLYAKFKNHLNFFYLTESFPYQTEPAYVETTEYNDIEFVGCDEPDECLISLEDLREIIDDLKKSGADYLTIHYNTDKQGYVFDGFKIETK
jgi:hypothetical protein